MTKKTGYSAWLPMASLPLLLLASSIFLFGTTNPSNAQSIHLPPAKLPPLKTCKQEKDFCNLLTIIPSRDPAKRVLNARWEVRVFMDKIWFLGEEGQITSFDLLENTLHDLVLELRDAFPEADILTQYPEYSGRYLRQLGPEPIGVKKGIKGDLGGAQIHATIGAIFGLSEVDEVTGDSQLLSNGGLQLDFVGQYPFSNRIFGRARMTFTTNEPQTVGNIVDSTQVGAETPGSGSTPQSANRTLLNQDAQDGDIESLISNTERFSMGVMLEWFILNESRQKMGLLLEYEIAWNALSDVPIPTFRRNGRQFSIFDIYPAERIGEVRQNLNRIEPISTFLGGATFHFPSSNNTSIHILANVGWTE